MKRPPSASTRDDAEDRTLNQSQIYPRHPSPSSTALEHGERRVEYLSDTRGLAQSGGGGEARGRRRSNDSAARVSTGSAHGVSRTQIVSTAATSSGREKEKIGDHTSPTQSSTAPPSSDGPESSPSQRQSTSTEKGRTERSASGAWDSEGKDRAFAMRSLPRDYNDESLEGHSRRRWRMRSPWAWSKLMFATLALAALLLYNMADSFMNRQRDQPGCRIPYMYPSFIKFADFDTEHTRFASKYSLHMYRERYIDEDPKVKGVPVLFIPGNAGSHKQVRSFGSEAAKYFNDEMRHDLKALTRGKRALDIFSADFNEDITAFHGQTLLDQAEYLNDAIAYILSLYHNPHRSERDSDLPDPSSVILIGHSMGGIVARTMLTMPNYQPSSVNTIITLSAPHSRAPISFDADIVRTYKHINDYWRQAYSQHWASDNPLWHVTLISLAGGGLDSVVPSDYASVASLVPETNGFTVFTSGIPHVWTGMDHLAITWCNQLMKSVVRSVMDVIDANRATQTRPRAQRMRHFRKRFLTGIEDSAEKTFTQKDSKTVLKLEDSASAVISQDERLIIRSLGGHEKPKAYFMPIPPQGTPEARRFALLTDQHIDTPAESGKLEVLFCSVAAAQSGVSQPMVSLNEDLINVDGSISTKVSCKSAASDVIALPASTKNSKYPFEDTEPFSYLQYDLEDLADQQFVAIVDKAPRSSSGFVIAEFTATADSTISSSMGLGGLLAVGMHVRLPSTRPLATDIEIPALHSSLLAYKLEIRKSGGMNAEEEELFQPLLRQHISEVHESKFFVNVERADISLHGVAPYLPPPVKKLELDDGLGLQIWSDPTTRNSLDIFLTVDIMGSIGKLWMRYRTIFAAFPLLVVALALRKQFKIYDEQGIFMSFSESMNMCMRTSLPVLFIALTCLAVTVTKSSHPAARASSSSWISNWRGNATEGFIDYSKNGLLLGSQDTFFWFLVPFFGLLCSGICIAMNFVTVALTHILALIFQCVKALSPKHGEESRRTHATFSAASPRQRVLTTSVLLLLVASVIPYQFAYLVLCVTQLATCVRALLVARENRTEASYNFYNYTASLFNLLLWILPINMPTLFVWVRNLALHHWLTPGGSSLHNLMSITPYILLISTFLSSGRMIPRLHSRIRFLTNALLFFIAVYAAVYGVTYAYLLHQLVNVLCAWLVAVHLSTSSFSLARLRRVVDGSEAEGLVKKRP